MLGLSAVTQTQDMSHHQCRLPIRAVYNTADSGLTDAERTLSRLHNHTADSHHPHSNVVWCGTDHPLALCNNELMKR